MNDVLSLNSLFKFIMFKYEIHHCNLYDRSVLLYKFIAYLRSKYTDQVIYFMFNRLSDKELNTIGLIRTTVNISDNTYNDIRCRNDVYGDDDPDDNGLTLFLIESYNSQSTYHRYEILTTVLLNFIENNAADIDTRNDNEWGFVLSIC